MCSGIEAASVAWEPLGWEPVAFSEVDAFPSAVLKHHWPHVPNLGDMNNFNQWDLPPFDVLVGGTPCTSFSLAGLRQGLEDPRGQLMLVYLGILAKFRPRYAIWENVPGVLSSNKGRDFGSFLGGLAELGYGFCYRVLDARYHGVPQRRRRVFVVASLGDWQPAAQVLLESEGVRRNPAPRRKTRSETAETLTASTGGADENDAEQGRLIVHTTGAGWWQTGAGTLRAREQESHEHLVVEQLAFGGNNTSGPIEASTAMLAHSTVRCDFESETFIMRRVSYGLHLTQDPIEVHEGTPCLSGGNASGCSSMGVVAFTCKDYGADVGEVSPTLRAMGHTGSHPNGGGQVAIATSMAVRRLTPRETERLQGFPDDHTLIPWRGKAAAECPDGPRYKAVGNSMAVPVMNWIGRRIQRYEDGELG